MTLEERIEDLLEDNERRVKELQNSIATHSRALGQVAAEMSNGTLSSATTCQVTPLANSNQHDLMLLIGEFNARVLWRNALQKALDKNEDE